MILVIEDDEDVRRAITDALTTLAYPSRQASDGAEGLALFQEIRPSLVILDHKMPEMSGAEVAREMRKIDPEIPIIFASGFAENADLKRHAGPDTPVLSKPFRLGELAELIAERLAPEPG